MFFIENMIRYMSRYVILTSVANILLPVQRNVLSNIVINANRIDQECTK